MRRDTYGKSFSISMNAMKRESPMRKRNESEMRVRSILMSLVGLSIKCETILTIVSVTNLPPSRAGSGRRLKKPRESDMRAIKRKRTDMGILLSTACTNAEPIPIGHATMAFAASRSPLFSGKNAFLPSSERLYQVSESCEVNSFPAIVTAVKNDVG